MKRIETTPGFLRWAGLAVAVLGVLAPALGEAQTGQQFYAVTPCRIVDTRVVNPQQPAPRNTKATALPVLYPPPCPGAGCQPEWTGPTEPENPQYFKVRAVSQFDGTGDCGIPTGATGVSVNVTLAQPKSNGNIRLWPYGGSMPLVSTLNVTTSDNALANGAIIPLPAYNAANPDISVRFTTGSRVGTTVQLILDVTGYFQ
jgi:hypothetical protein